MKIGSIVALRSDPTSRWRVISREADRIVVIARPGRYGIRETMRVWPESLIKQEEVAE